MRLTSSRAAIFGALVLIAGLGTTVRADERIITFNSTITVHRDSTMDVTETVRVEAEGRAIRHGIYRDFPTIYRDQHDNPYVVGFHVRTVRCDGHNEPYHQERLDNGIRVYIGNKDRWVPNGNHIYELAYTTDRQLGFLADHDELYWNVTGNGWIFPMDHVTATVNLPESIAAADINVTGYTGHQGSRAQNFTSHVTDHQAQFATTQPLQAHEGLTVVVGWPVGIVNHPTAWMQFLYNLRDHAGILFVFAVLMGILAYFYMAWTKVGVDPEAGTIIPLYGPPSGISPAEMRYIENMDYDHTAFAAAIIDIAVKGGLTIEDREPLVPLLSRKTYVLRKQKDVADLTAEEKIIMNGLFRSQSEITLGNTYNSSIELTASLVRDHLKQKCEGAYFNRNTSSFTRGFLASVVAFALFIMNGDNWLLPFWAFIVLGAGLVAINGLFWWLLRAPTLTGRVIMDKIEGFRMFLSISEKDRLNLLNPPERTPQLFEMFLPYALALGVEQRWGQQFAQVFAHNGGSQGQAYTPIWYTGGPWGGGTPFNPGTFASSLNTSMSHVISSAATPPSSSSGSGGGFGGGGFSGGGGGGGGGGGW